jgi:hypothetical protein
MELLRIIQSVPEPEALEIFQRLRATRDVEEILRQVQDGNLLIQVSSVPETPVAPGHVKGRQHP